MRRRRRSKGTRDLLTGPGFTARQMTALVMGLFLAVVCSRSRHRPPTWSARSSPTPGGPIRPRSMLGAISACPGSPPLLHFSRGDDESS
jgi:hypothetical protein